MARQACSRSKPAGRAKPARNAAVLLGGCAMTDPCASSAHAAIERAGRGRHACLGGAAVGRPRRRVRRRRRSDALLARLGCGARMAVPGRAQALLGRALDAAGTASASPALPDRASRASLAARCASHLRTLRSYPSRCGNRLQMKRVRYLLRKLLHLAPDGLAEWAKRALAWSRARHRSSHSRRRSRTGVGNRSA